VILRRLGLLNRNQLGFTLIELLIALAITGVITSAATATIFQVFDGNTRSSNHMEAIRQAQNAGYWVSRDAKMAQVIDLGDNPATSELELVTLTWTTWDDNTKHTVTYTLQGTELWRDYDGQSRCVAEYIDPDPANTNCALAAGSFFYLPDSNDAFTIISAAGGDSGTITVDAGSISVATTGTATYNSGIWTTPGAGDTITVAASETDTAGEWTSTAGTATANITVDSDGDAALAGGALVLTVTAKVGSGSQQQSETRVYEVIPRPSIKG
jgi:prepilin-type N-terminal cleavage/methylation domain-containing protein